MAQKVTTEFDPCGHLVVIYTILFTSNYVNTNASIKTLQAQPTAYALYSVCSLCMIEHQFIQKP